MTNRIFDGSKNAFCPIDHRIENLEGNRNNNKQYSQLLRCTECFIAIDEVPDLDRFSVGEKDALIRKLWVPVSALQAKVLELEARLAQNISNWSQLQSLRTR